MPRYQLFDPEVNIRLDAILDQLIENTTGKSISPFLITMVDQRLATHPIYVLYPQPNPM